MNTNQYLPIVGFSICGIEGFKTISTEPSKVKLRTYSALVELGKSLREISARETAETEQYELVQEALEAHNEITRYFSIGEDEPHIDINPVPVGKMTKEEFFADPSKISSENLELFLKNIPAIRKTYDQIAIRVNQERNEERKKNDHTPYLHICTGAIFGSGGFPLILTASTVNSYNTEDMGVVVRALCLKALEVVKGSYLSDYQRKENAREKTRALIDRIDSYIDSLSQITVTGGHCLIDIPFRKREESNDTDKAGQVLETESQNRLMTYIRSMAGLQNTLGDGQLPDAYDEVKTA